MIHSGNKEKHAEISREVPVCFFAGDCYKQVSPDTPELTNAPDACQLYMVVVSSFEHITFCEQIV